jgi:N-acetylglucosamine kinase-like BadF-type ATPase
MAAPRHKRATLAVGVDVGGTWTRVLALDGSRTAGRLVRRIPAADVPQLLRAAWTRLRWHGRVAALVVASRGVWTPGERRALARRFHGLAPKVIVIADAQAALLGALGVRPGILVLAGTGSIVLGHDGRGRWARAGGLGPLLGDEGSAFWLGREWLRVTMAAQDESSARRLVVRPDAVARIAALAPRVLARARRGDRIARAVVRDGQRALARQGLSVARRLGLAAPIAISWAGGVMADAWYRAGVIRHTVHEGLGARWSAPQAEPVEASARMAVGLVRPAITSEAKRGRVDRRQKPRHRRRYSELPMTTRRRR